MVQYFLSIKGLKVVLWQEDAAVLAGVAVAEAAHSGAGRVEWEVSVARDGQAAAPRHIGRPRRFLAARLLCARHFSAGA